jgi:homoserine acetyltransferase
MQCCVTEQNRSGKEFRTSTDSSRSFQVESWLNYHGERIAKKRFEPSAYKMMNQLLKTIDITRAGDVF